MRSSLNHVLSVFVVSSIFCLPAFCVTTDFPNFKLSYDSPFVFDPSPGGYTANKTAGRNIYEFLDKKVSKVTLERGSDYGFSRIKLSIAFNPKKGIAAHPSYVAQLKGQLIVSPSDYNANAWTDGTSGDLVLEVPVVPDYQSKLKAVLEDLAKNYKIPQEVLRHIKHALNMASAEEKEEIREVMVQESIKAAHKVAVTPLGEKDEKPAQIDETLIESILAKVESAVPAEKEETLDRGKLLVSAANALWEIEKPPEHYYHLAFRLLRKVPSTSKAFQEANQNLVEYDFTHNPEFQIKQDDEEEVRKTKTKNKHIAMVEGACNAPDDAQAQRLVSQELLPVITGSRNEIGSGVQLRIGRDAKSIVALIDNFVQVRTQIEKKLEEKGAEVVQEKKKNEESEKEIVQLKKQIGEIQLALQLLQSKYDATQVTYTDTSGD